MLSRVDRNIANEFRRRLEQVVPIRDFVVFGSRARGDAAPDSDLNGSRSTCAQCQARGSAPLKPEQLDELLEVLFDG